MDTIVVGIDGSDDSAAAVRFAADEARLRGAALRLVCAWQIPPSIYGGPIVFPLPELRDSLQSAARAALDEAVAQIEPQDLPIETVAPEAAPASALVEQSGNAALLVVGSRGRGGFKGLLLGSVSSHCAQHARCPVVIVRGVGAAADA